jgi:hypothetical protein
VGGQLNTTRRLVDGLAIAAPNLVGLHTMCLAIAMSVQ